MRKVIGLAFEGCQATGLTSPFDVFNVANSIWQQKHGTNAPLYECQLISRQGGLIQCSNGIQLRAPLSFSDMPNADLIIIPGVHHLDVKSLLGRLTELTEEIRWLAHYIHRDTLIAANCSGVFLLAETGALKGKKATTAWWLAKIFAHRYPDVQHCKNTMLVKEERRFTSGSMTANLGAMLELVESQAGRSLAQNAARNMLIDVSHAIASPYVFMQTQMKHQDSLVLTIESHLQHNLSQTICLDEMAEKYAISSRNLSRRFKAANGMSLSEYLQKLRLEHTKLLLESSNLSIEQISDRVGYANQSSLRKLFKTAFGESPSQFRKRVHKQLDTKP